MGWGRIPASSEKSRHGAGLRGRRAAREVATSVAVLDAVGTKYAQCGKSVESVGLKECGVRMHRTLSGALSGSH